MSPAEWLRAVEIWSPFPVVDWDHWPTKEERFAALSEALPMRFPSFAFCEASVKLVAQRCDTFPNFYWCCEALEEFLS